MKHDMDNLQYINAALTGSPDSNCSYMLE